MEGSKIPKPGSIASRLKPLAGPSRVKNEAMPKNTKPPLPVVRALHRRSKSVSDLRSLQSSSKPIAHGKLVKITDKPAPVRLGQKRPALQKCGDENKPKVLKIRIPEWDYKSRFQELQKKSSTVQDDLKRLKTQIAELPALTTERDVLRTQVIEFEEENKLCKETIAELTKDRDNFKSSFVKISTQLTKLENQYQEIQTSYQEIQEECTELRQYKAKFEVKQCEVEDLKTLNRELREQLNEKDVLRRQLHNAIQDLKGNIRVFCRVRPPLYNENEKQLCAIFCTSESTIEIRKCRESVSTLTGKPTDLKQDFTFDKVFPPEAQQDEIFDELAPLIQSAMDGYHVCVFAYGQTGSGKTHTMQGTSEHLGMIPRTIDAVFSTIDKLKITDWTYTVSASCLEIYNESIRDLLVPNSSFNYELRYNEGRGVTVTNLKTVPIDSAQELKSLMEDAHKNRAVAATDFNEHSSRSHAVTKIYLEGFNKVNNTNLYGSINLVDLAGSESAKTSSNDRLVETKSINKSLSTLGNVMLALHNKDPHVPYRNSKLTFLLQSCLGGNSKTLMFVNISPFEECYSESINSLRFAAKVKEIKMAAKRNKTYQPM